LRVEFLSAQSNGLTSTTDPFVCHVRSPSLSLLLLLPFADPERLRRPKLNILVHKSYHPYLEKNKDRVRKDEEKEQLRIEHEEQRSLQAVSPFSFPSLSLLPAAAQS
jgi:hypothetical protein